MPHNRTNGNLALAGYDDIFESTVTATANETILIVSIAELHPPEFHPFQVNDDELMHKLAENIKLHGVREPGIARPRALGGYELLVGNRRKRGSELANLTTMPVIIRKLDDDSATLVMVESNLQQRENILPSERAWAYKVMMEALNHNGVKGESHSYKIMEERTGVKKNQLFRTIRLTELIADLADRVDTKKLAFSPAVELSYLTVKEQTLVAEAMDAHEVKPSLSQAIRLKNMEKGTLTTEAVNCILSEEKKPSNSKNVSGDNDKYRSFFPDNYTTTQIDEIIKKLLSNWKADVAV